MMVVRMSKSSLCHISLFGQCFVVNFSVQSQKTKPEVQQNCVYTIQYILVSVPFFNRSISSFLQQVNTVKIAKCTYDHLFIMVLRSVVAAFLLHFCELPKILLIVQ